MDGTSDDRSHLLLAARDFVLGSAKLQGIARIALVGSLTTDVEEIPVAGLPWTGETA